MRVFSREDLSELWKPDADSHKGNNGRVLVIGGSKLFHTSIFWSADVASRVVDLVHFASPVNENNEVVRTRIKEGFWTGIVVDWSEIDRYVEEDDAVLIGPGMPRREGLMEGEVPTDEIVNGLLAKYPNKRWVVDGGALQEVDPGLLNQGMIITPHFGELKRLVDKTGDEFLISNFEFLNNDQNLDDLMFRWSEYLMRLSEKLRGCTVLLKNVEGKDIVCGSTNDSCVVIEGGNEGLTKGGTGDVLAGLVVAFYTKNEAVMAASAASYVLKKTADVLYEEKGSYYNAGDVVSEVGRVCL